MESPSKAVITPLRQKPKRGLFYTAHGIDIPLLIILMLLLSIGLVCMFSASYVYAGYYDGDSYFYIKKQALFAVLGIGIMFAASLVDYHILHHFAIPLMFVSVGLLALVLFMPSQTGVHRWISVPGLGQFQPSELAKFAVILLFAHLISLNYKKMKSFRLGFLPFLGILGLVCVLVVREPHLSGTILILGIGIVMMYVGGTRVAYLGGLIAVGVAGVLFLVIFKGYEQDRINVWLHPLESFANEITFEDGISGRDHAWQTVQSLYAIGSGGLMGVGLGNSRQKHLFLPEPQNDFVFAIVCEELGLIGAAVIIILFALLVWRGILIAVKPPDKFGSMLAVGISAQIGIQVILNIAVVTNSMPNTGIGLPFFSYGGSSMLMLLAEMGVLLSVSRQSHLKKE